MTFSPKLSKNGVELSTSTSKAPQNVTKTHQSKIILQESSSNSQQVIKKNVNQEVSQRSVKLEVRRSSDEIDENKPEFKVPVMLVKQKQFQGTPV